MSVFHGRAGRHEHQEWFDLRSLSTSTLRDLKWIIRHRRGRAELALRAAIQRILAER